MNTNQQQNDIVRIAVPYYGALTLPPSGLSRVYFIVDVNRETKSIDNICLQVWNPKKEPNVSSWLRQLNTDGVICSDNPSKYEIALNTEGIWVQWKQEGEVHEVVERWIQSQLGSSPAVSHEKPQKENSVACSLKPLWQLG